MLQIQVLTPQGIILERQVDEVRAPGTIGEFGILPGHIPFVSSIVPGTLWWRFGSERGSLTVDSGFVEVDQGGNVYVLVRNATVAAGE